MTTVRRLQVQLTVDEVDD